MSTTAITAPACATMPKVFQHPLLEDGTVTGAEARKQQNLLIRRAERACAACPLMADCLYTAVVDHDVAGFVAGTTQRQRAEIRARLGVRVAAQDLDTLAGVTTPNRQIDHEEVIRLRNANPYESLDSIARRLGCSLSTVKRHLRKARAADAPEPTATLQSVRPSVEQVLQAHRDVVERSNRRERSAA
ncbi:MULTISPECIES: WhiB family transcriptional regulator [Aestuariimicrobium]|uniref:WhiB family transcriptional regulator n=1 Tax=Aestuariimicrobium TaxID=396388 RepID=UPI0003B66BA6|nr:MULTISPECIES: WhiB family transcriptional regulator [Aestuariimicrobium]CAI9402489.1 Transcriptional regulator WhiB [Aestuariimicrobium sp. T2.26MG-19.2B]